MTPTTQIDPSARYTLRVRNRKAPFASMSGRALKMYLALHPEAKNYDIRKVS